MWTGAALASLASLRGDWWQGVCVCVYMRDREREREEVWGLSLRRLVATRNPKPETRNPNPKERKERSLGSLSAAIGGKVCGGGGEGEGEGEGEVVWALSLRR
jgi:hypothetical protein